MDTQRLDVVSAMHVGTASVNWGFDPFYTWATTPPFGRMLDEMALAGYEGTEISYNFPDDSALLREELQRRNLRPAGTFHAVNLRDRANHDAALESSLRVGRRLRDLGSDVLILSDYATPQRMQIGGRVTPDDMLDRAVWPVMAEGLHRIAQALRALGIRAVFHPHVGTYVETLAEIERLCEVTDPALIALCPDTGHLAYAGADPNRIFTDYRDRIGYVHLKDVDPATLQRVRSERIGFTEAVRMGMFVELGTGMVDAARIIKSLREARYSGWIVVEQDAPREPLASATANRRYLRERCAI